MQQLEQMDVQLQQTRLLSEQGLNKYGTHPWSQRFKQAHMRVHYWKLWVSEFKTH